MQKQIDNLEKRIATNIDRCKRISKKETDDDLAVVAYVQFRSMEGRERAFSAYKIGGLKRFMLTYLCC